MNSEVLSFQMIYTHCLQKFGNALDNGVLDYIGMNPFLICDNFALIRDNTNYENIFYYISSLYIEKIIIFD